MMGKKVYLQPADMILNAIHDLEELQKGTRASCDTARGLVSFSVTMYSAEREYHFAVSDIGRNRCSVAISIACNVPDNERMIDHEFALLDYVLLDRANIELTQIEEQDRRILAERSDGSDNVV